jgi:hypothetical protein
LVKHVGCTIKQAETASLLQAVFKKDIPCILLHLFTKKGCLDEVIMKIIMNFCLVSHLDLEYILELFTFEPLYKDGRPINTELVKTNPDERQDVFTKDGKTFDPKRISSEVARLTLESWERHVAGGALSVGEATSSN